MSILLQIPIYGTHSCVSTPIIIHVNLRYVLLEISYLTSVMMQLYVYTATCICNSSQVCNISNFANLPSDVSIYVTESMGWKVGHYNYDFMDNDETMIFVSGEVKGVVHEYCTSEIIKHNDLHIYVCTTSGRFYMICKLITSKF